MLYFHFNLSNKNISGLQAELEKNRIKGDLQTTHRITAILAVGSGHDIETVSDIMNISYKTVYPSESLLRYEF